MYCANCGAQITNNKHFCSHCGAKVEIAEAKPRGKRRLWILIPIIFLMAVGTSTLLWFLPVGEADAEEQVELSHRLMDEGDYAGAAAAFQSAIDIKPECYDAYLGLGDACRGLNEIEDAIDAYTCAIKIDPVLPAPYLCIADICIDSGDDNKARAILDEGYRNTGDEEISALLKTLEKRDSVYDASDPEDALDPAFIVAIAAWDTHSVGLRADGTVVATAYVDPYAPNYNTYSGQCDVEDWSDIVGLAAGTNVTIGTKADGTVVAVGSDIYGNTNISDWTDIVQVAVGQHTIGLRADGTVIAVEYDGEYYDNDYDFGQAAVGDWGDIVAIAAGEYHSVGLRADGTVVATQPSSEYIDHGQCDVDNWSNIVAIAAGRALSVGLRADGTVVAAGNAYDSACDVDNWTDIVAIGVGSSHTVGVRADGTVIATGYNDFGQCNVEGWTDIVAVAAGTFHTIGLRSDGTVVSTVLTKIEDGYYGFLDFGQCTVSGWGPTAKDEDGEDDGKEMAVQTDTVLPLMPIELSYTLDVPAYVDLDGDGVQDTLIVTKNTEAYVLQLSSSIYGDFMLQLDTFYVTSGEIIAVDIGNGCYTLCVTCQPEGSGGLIYPTVFLGSDNGWRYAGSAETLEEYGWFDTNINSDYSMTVIGASGYHIQFDLEINSYLEAATAGGVDDVSRVSYYFNEQRGGYDFVFGYLIFAGAHVNGVAFGYNRITVDTATDTLVVAEQWVEPIG